MLLHEAVGPDGRAPDPTLGSQGWFSAGSHSQVKIRSKEVSKCSHEVGIMVTVHFDSCHSYVVPVYSTHSYIGIPRPYAMNHNIE